MIPLVLRVLKLNLGKLALSFLKLELRAGDSVVGALQLERQLVANFVGLGGVSFSPLQLSDLMSIGGLQSVYLGCGKFELALKLKDFLLLFGLDSIQLDFEKSR